MDLLTSIQNFLKEYYGTFSHLPLDEKRPGNPLAHILDRASTNLDFRHSLLNEPGKALKKEGFELPADFQVIFVEDTEDTIHLPLLPFIGDDPHPAEAGSPKIDAFHILGKALLDRGFRNELLREPVKTLKKEGFDIPENKNVQILESTDNLLYVVLPPYGKL
jgi:hypothetical protein